MWRIWSRVKETSIAGLPRPQRVRGGTNWYAVWLTESYGYGISVRGAAASRNQGREGKPFAVDSNGRRDPDSAAHTPPRTQVERRRRGSAGRVRDGSRTRDTSAVPDVGPLGSPDGLAPTRTFMPLGRYCLPRRDLLSAGTSSRRSFTNDMRRQSTEFLLFYSDSHESPRTQQRATRLQNRHCRLFQRSEHIVMASSKSHAGLGCPGVRAAQAFLRERVLTVRAWARVPRPRSGAIETAGCAALCPARHQAGLDLLHAGRS